MINYIESNELIDKIQEYDVILVAANIYGTMNNGFAEDIRQRYPFVYERNTQMPYGDVTRLGQILEVKKDDFPIFVLCYIVKYKNKNKDCVEYDALGKALRLVNSAYKGKKIASTLLGVDVFEGNGDKDRIKEMFDTILTNVDIDVFCFKQDSHLVKWAKALKECQKYSDAEKEAFIKESKKKITKNESKTRINRRPFEGYSIHLNQERKR